MPKGGVFSHATAGTLHWKKTVGNEKDVRHFIRRLYYPVSVLGVLIFQCLYIPASFSASLLLGVFGVFIFGIFFRRLYFSASLFFGLGVFGCLWRPAAAVHNRISIKFDQKLALASQPDRLSVFFAACRLLFSYVFYRRLFFPACFPASLFPGVFFRRHYVPASFSASLFAGVFYF